MDNILRLEQDGFRIEISNDVLKIWKQYRQNSIWLKEACGVLIGGYDPSQRVIYVKQCTVPMKGDLRRRTSYIIKDKGHQEIVDRNYLKSDGRRFYLGTWHTHPEQHPTPSFLDSTDWLNCIKRNSNLPVFLFVIVGTKSRFLHPKENIK